MSEPTGATQDARKVCGACGASRTLRELVYVLGTSQWKCKRDDECVKRRETA